MFSLFLPVDHLNYALLSCSPTRNYLKNKITETALVQSEKDSRKNYTLTPVPTHILPLVGKTGHTRPQLHATTPVIPP